MLNSLLHTYGDAAVFLLLLLEAAGLPFPGETVMMAAALYAARTHHLAVLPLYLSAWLGAVLGYIVAYALGRRYGAPLLERFGGRIGFNADRRLLANYLMRRNGAALVLLGRNMAVLRSVCGLLAGIAGMNVPRFLVFNAAGAAVWTGFYCLGVYFLGGAVLGAARWVGVVLAVVAILVVGALFVAVRKHEARWTREAKEEQFFFEKKNQKTFTTQ